MEYLVATSLLLALLMALTVILEYNIELTFHPWSL
jgi:hypothetical protein